MSLHDAKLLDHQTTNCTGTPAQFSPWNNAIYGAKLTVEGVMGGATVTFEWSMDGTNYYPLKDRSPTPVTISVTAAGAAIPVDICRSECVRAIVTGASGTTDITSRLVELG